MRKKLSPLLTLVLASLIISPGPAHPDTDKTRGRERRVLTFAVIPFYGPEKIWNLYTPFTNYLNKATGLRWELKLFHNHEEVIAGLCNGEVSIALLGPAPLGIAAKNCGIEPLIVALGRDGRLFYHSVIIAPKVGVNDLAGLRGKRFGVFRGSTAAHILPIKMLREAGVAEKDITPIFHPNREDILKAVVSGEVAAAGVKESLYLKFKDAPLKALKTEGQTSAYCEGLRRRDKERLCAAAGFFFG